MEKTQKQDFVEIKYSGYANNELFDSNIEDDVKKLNPKAAVKKTIIIIGQGMVVPGLDKALEDKELEKEYRVTIHPSEGFGERNRSLIKTIPLSSFTEQKVDPRPGMVLTLDNHLVKIIAVSGARVTTDFNNPMAGKNLEYRFKIIRKTVDEKEKVETVLKLLFKFLPEHEISEHTVTIKGPKPFQQFVYAIKDKFKELAQKNLEFKEEKAVK